MALWHGFGMLFGILYTCMLACAGTCACTCVHGFGSACLPARLAFAFTLFVVPPCGASAFGRFTCACALTWHAVFACARVGIDRTHPAFYTPCIATCLLPRRHACCLLGCHAPPSSPSLSCSPGRRNRQTHAAAVPPGDAGGE